MHVYVKVFGVTIPSYGLAITIGVIVANLIALAILHKEKQDFNDFIILEAYAMLGAFIGAKLLYFIVSAKEIIWSRFFEFAYFNQLMLGGFVFYGGLLGGIGFIFIGGKIHKIDYLEYIRNYIFLIPFIHCFGRVGCFLAGCCYGRPYNGFGAVIFPKDSYAIPGIKLLPVQLIEAFALLIISLILIILRFYKHSMYTVEAYLLLYGAIRFVLEFLRYDAARGKIGGLSTSQWISIFLIVVAIISIMINKRKIKLE